MPLQRGRASGVARRSTAPLPRRPSATPRRKRVSDVGWTGIVPPRPRSANSRTVSPHATDASSARATPVAPAIGQHAIRAPTNARHAARPPRSAARRLCSATQQPRYASGACPAPIARELRTSAIHRRRAAFSVSTIADAPAARSAMSTRMPASSASIMPSVSSRSRPIVNSTRALPRRASRALGACRIEIVSASPVSVGSAARMTPGVWNAFRTRSAPMIPRH